jgi:hypothetical protein
VQPNEASNQEVGPSLFYLPDKDGKLQPVLNLGLEEFRELWDLRRQVAPGLSRPAFALEEVRASGRLKQGRAELEISLAIALHRDGWNRVPLELPELVLTQPEQQEGADDVEVGFDAEKTGWFAWIQGKDGQRVDLRLTGIAPVERSGDVDQLKLRFPKAKQSELRLIAEQADVTVRGAGVSKVEVSPADDGGSSTILAVGLRGEVVLALRPKTPQHAPTGPGLESKVNVLYACDTRRIQAQAQLTLRSDQEPLQRVSIRLPEGFRATTGPFDEYQVTVAAAEPRLAEIEWLEPRAGTLQVQILAEATRPTGEAAWTLDLGGWGVVGSTRHSGSVAVQGSPDALVTTGTPEAAEAIPLDALPEGLERARVLAGYEIRTADWKLPVTVAQRPSHVTVRPTYLVEVSPEEARLKAELRYSLRGARYSELLVDLAGWEFVEVSPARLVDVLPGEEGEGGLLRMRLTEESTGDVTVELTARRSLIGVERLDLVLPRAQAQTLLPTTLVVIPDDNVELKPREAALVGFTVSSDIPELKLPARQQAPLIYRSDRNGTLSFQADIEIHSRRMMTGISSRATVDLDQVRVEQDFTYNISYVPISELLLDLPNLPATANVEVRLDGQAVSATPGPTDGNSADGRVLWRVPLTRPRLGEVRLSLAYNLATDRLSPGASNSLQLPLALPKEGEISSHEVVVTPRAGVVVRSAPNSSWVTAEDGRGTRRQRIRGLRLSDSERTTVVPLVAQREGGAGADRPLVERLWIQTWLGRTSRQERVVALCSTIEPQLQIALPAGVVRDELEATVDRVAVTARTTPDGKLEIPLSAEENRRQRHVVELRYRFVDQPRNGSQLELEPPRLVEDAWARRVYWQVVLPPDEHLLTPPGQFTHDFEWVWQGLGWRRQPLLEQFQLETWVGAQHLELVPSGTNRYLFSAQGSLAAIHSATIRRSSLVLIASGAALVLGLILIYLPWARHPAWLLMGSVTLAATAAIAPETTLLVAQAAGLGFLLAGLAGWLQRNMESRERPMPVRRSGSSIVQRDALDYVPASDGRHAISSTQTVPLAPAPESSG